MYSFPQKCDQCCTVTQVQTWHWFYLGFHDLAFYVFNMTVNINILFFSDVLSLKLIYLYNK